MRRDFLLNDCNRPFLATDLLRARHDDLRVDLGRSIVLSEILPQLGDKSSARAKQSAIAVRATSFQNTHYLSTCCFSNKSCFLLLCFDDRGCVNFARRRKTAAAAGDDRDRACSRVRTPGADRKSQQLWQQRQLLSAGATSILIPNNAMIRCRREQGKPQINRENVERALPGAEISSVHCL